MNLSNCLKWLFIYFYFYHTLDIRTFFNQNMKWDETIQVDIVWWSVTRPQTWPDPTSGTSVKAWNRPHQQPLILWVETHQCWSELEQINTSRVETRQCWSELGQINTSRVISQELSVDVCGVLISGRRVSENDEQNQNQLVMAPRYFWGSHDKRMYL